MATSKASSKLWQWLDGIWSAVLMMWRAIVSRTADRSTEPKDKLKGESLLHDAASLRDQTHQQATPPIIVTAKGTIPVRTSESPLRPSKDPAIREMTLPVEEQTSPYQVADSGKVEQNAPHKDLNRGSRETSDTPALVMPPKVLVRNPSVVGVESSGNPDIERTGEVIDDSQMNGTLTGRVDESGDGLKSLPKAKTRKLGASEDSEMSVRIAPIERGGRPRGQQEVTEADHSISNERIRKLRPQRPELVCWLQGMAWVLGIEMPEGCQEAIRARQGADLILEEDDTQYACLRLKMPFENVEFTFGEKANVDPKSWQIPANRFRLFKLTGAQGTRGRAVRQGTSGRFLVVVPDSWNWSQDLAGAAFGASEFVSTGECNAYLFDLPLEQGKILSLKTPEGETVPIPCATDHFELTGNRILDAHLEAGPLFGIEPPQLSLLDPSSQKRKVNAVVVGEEGSSGRKGTWRAQAESFEDIRPEIVRRGTGWFFIRLYDDHDDLIESLDFRFAEGLKDLHVENGPALPGASGHSEALIVFRHSGDCAVRPLSSGHLMPVAFSAGSIVHVPPKPEYDDSKWIVRDCAGFQIPLTVLVERIWWAIAHDLIETSGLKWTSLPFSLSREDFKATSVIAIRIRLPRPGWADELRIGFQGSRSRFVHLGAGERECVIPLRDLGEARELEEQAAARLSIWVVPRGRTAERLEGVVGFLPEVGVSLQDDGLLLSLRQLKPRLFMAVLTRVRTACCVPLRHMIRELRTESYERIPKHQRGTACEPFVKEGLCLLALAIEQLEVQKTRRINLPERWPRRARAAQVHFPDVMSAVRSRHREIEAELATKGGSETRPRTDRC